MVSPRIELLTIVPHFYLKIAKLKYITEAELLRNIIRYVKMPESEKQLRQAEMRSIVCEKYDIEKTKNQICQVIEDVLRETVS